MTTATLTLTDFLLARIAEDEGAAREATGGDRTGNWWLDPDEGGVTEVSCLDVQGFITAVDPDAAHIARHDPAHVLAECEAKRRILELHFEMDGGAPETFPYVADDGRMVWPGCAVCDQGSPRRPHCDTIRTLAAVYSDHPDYRDDWRP